MVYYSIVYTEADPGSVVHVVSMYAYNVDDSAPIIQDCWMWRNSHISYITPFSLLVTIFLQISDYTLLYTILFLFHGRKLSRCHALIWIIIYIY